MKSYFSHDSCGTDPAEITEYLTLYRKTHATFYSIRTFLKDGFYSCKAMFPVCSFCNKPMGPNSLKIFWENKGEVENDFNNIATAYQLLYESQILSGYNKRQIIDEFEKLKQDLTHAQNPPESPKKDPSTIPKEENKNFVTEPQKKVSENSPKNQHVPGGAAYKPQSIKIDGLINSHSVSTKKILENDVEKEDQKNGINPLRTMPVPRKMDSDLNVDEFHPNEDEKRLTHLVDDKNSVNEVIGNIKMVKTQFKETIKVFFYDIF